MQENRVDTVVHGGLVVTANSASVGAVAIKGEKIVAVGDPETFPPADRYIDATGKHVFPGLIDSHVHLDRVDGYGIGSIAGAHAGLTTLVPFGTYDFEAGETLVQAINRHREEISTNAVTDFSFHYILANQPYILETVPQAMDMGIKSFKMFMTYKKRPGRLCDDDYICQAMELVAKGGGVLQMHCESGNIIDYLENKLIEEGHTHPTFFPQACPTWAEEEAINRAVRMANVTNCPLYVVHLSSEVGLERIKQAQAAGQRVWAETCPQYLLLSDEEMAKVGPLAKIGPPLRAKDGPDQPAMWSGLELGYISTVASDHAPNPREEKEKAWDNIFVLPSGESAPFGSPGVETLAPLAYSEGVLKRGFPPSWLARVMSENPARIFGLYPRKGTIQVGSDADLSIFDPTGGMTVRAAEQHGNSGFSLFEGWQITGGPWMTLLRGQVLYNQGTIERKAGFGQFLDAEGPTVPLGGRVR